MGAVTRPLVLPRSTAHYIRITVHFYALRLVRSLIEQLCSYNIIEMDIHGHDIDINIPRPAHPDASPTPH